MTLSASNLIQENSFEDTATATSRSVSLPGATTDGNTVLVFIATNDIGTEPVAPSDWFLDLDHGGGGYRVWRLPNVTGGASSWTFTMSSATMIVWYAVEVSGLDSNPLDISAEGTSNPASGGTATAVNAVTTGGVSTMAFAAMQTVETTSGHTYTLSGWTNGFTERVDTGGPTAPGLAVAMATSSTATTYTTTATLTTTLSPTATVMWLMIAYREAGTAIVSPLYHAAGFEWGHHGGGGTLTGTGGVNMWGINSTPTGTWGTSYLIQTGSARATPSVYGLRMVASASVAQVPHGTPTYGTSTVTAGFNTRVVSGSGVVIVAELSGSGTVAQLVYDVSATKFGVRAGTTGTIQYQGGTTALNTWVWIDMRVQANCATWTVDWQIETGTNTYTAQTSATLSGQNTNTVSVFRTGSTTSQTMTADFDDLVLSRYPATFPLGPHNVRVLKVDPSATPTISGTTANFNTFASNGTLTAWNATTARNAVDELPATISASADGVVQVTVAASDYIEFPMETYTLGAQEVISSVRMIAPMWCTSGGGAVTAGFRGWDGTTETVLIAIGSTFNPAQPTAYATGAPLWRTRMWALDGGWTQTKLDAAAIRFGFATDIAPGLEALYLEVAVGKTRTIHAFGAIADVDEDPSKLGVVSVTVTAPNLGTGDTTLYYEEATVPTSVNVTAGNTTTEQINAALEGDVNYLAVYPPHEPDEVGI